MKWLVVFIIIIAIILTLIALIISLKQSTKPKQKNRRALRFEDLVEIVTNPKSTNHDILLALKIFNENFIIDKRNEQKYLVFFSRALTHKNADKDIFKYFHKEIKSKNSKFKKDLEIIERKALG